MPTLPYAIYVAVPQGEPYRIIERGRELPFDAQFALTTIEFGQDKLELHLLMGEMPGEAGFKTLAHFVIGGIPPAAASAARVKVLLQFKTDKFSLNFIDATTGKELPWHDMDAPEG